MGATAKIWGKSDSDGLRRVTKIGILLYPGVGGACVWMNGAAARTRCRRTPGFKGEFGGSPLL